MPAEVKTLAQFGEWAKANSGKANCGNPGEGSLPHFLTLLLARALGALIQPVPYRGGAPALADMMAGQMAALMLPDGAFLAYTKDSCSGTGDQRPETLAILSRRVDFPSRA